MTEQPEYSLEKSSKKLGALVPVIRDSEGNVIDGFHRLQVDANWPSIRLEHVKGKVKLNLARLAVNLHRRMVPTKEKEMLLGEIAELTGWNARQIADALGMSERWVYKYLPEKFKDKEKSVAGQAGGQISAARRAANNVHQIQGQALAELVECDNCHMGVHKSKAQKIGAKILCPTCYDQLPEVSKRIAQKLDEKPAETKAKVLDSWRNREARMHPQHSKMEEALLLRMENTTLRPVLTDKSFCLQATTPDFYFPEKKLAVYIDGPAHQKRQEKDEKLRDLLSNRHGVKVLSIPYTAMSNQEVERIFSIIKEEVL